MTTPCKVDRGWRVFVARVAALASLTAISLPAPAAITAFADVPGSYWAAAWIEEFAAEGISAGCASNPLRFCPSNTVTRAEMAVFLLRAIHGASYQPPAATSPFADVASNHWAKNWITQLYSEGVTSGCGANPLMFCPDGEVSRAEMAVFMLRASHGSTYVPPIATNVFADVTNNSGIKDWVNQFSAEGITSGCAENPLRYCPTNLVSRAEMSVFLLRMIHGASYQPPELAGIYTDLMSAPVGAFVTVYGIDSAVSSWPVYSHGNGKTVVKVPTAAPALTVNGKSVPVSVNSGRVIEATPSDLAAKFKAIKAGDVIYLHAGTYTGRYDANGWNESNFVLFVSGTQALPMALVAYPGEAVTIDNSGSSSGRPNFYLGDSGGGRKGSYFTIAGLNLIAKEATIYGGGNTADSSHPESGAAYVRVVGCTHTITDSTSNTMTGIVSMQGDGWKVLGNAFNDPANRTIINNNHGIYVQNGADDVEIAYNTLLNLRMGHTIQVHQDGTPMLYSNVWIHDNLIQNATNSDARGFSVSNVDVASTIKIEHNTIRNVGQGFGGLTLYRGQIEVRNNTFDNVAGPAIMANGGYGGSRKITDSGNTFTNVTGGSFAAVNGASLSDFVHQ
jgi:hypothetical protein